jgi:hypothetical protein
LKNGPILFDVTRNVDIFRSRWGFGEGERGIGTKRKEWSRRNEEKGME